MKTRNIFLLALTALLTVSCHSWDDPSEEAGLKSIGNQYIQATNVKTIAEIKSSFQNEINNNGLKQVTKPTQIQGIVIGDDAGSNLYKQIYVQDATGALCISINKSGLFSETAVGQCVMIELEGLYVGGYGKQGQVGISYTDPSKENATAQVGRMSRYTWDEHFKLIPAIEGLSVKPITLRSLESLDLAADCGKLVKLVGVKLKNADGKIVFAPSDGSAKLVGGCVNRDIDGMSNVVVRTSTYAKFANEVMPTEKVNITGIAARYNDTWQIMPRTADDIELTTGDEKTDDDVPEVDPAGTGTEADPFNVAAAIAKCQQTGETATEEIFFVKGLVSADYTVDSYKNATLVLVDALGATKAKFTAYRVKGADGKGLKEGYKIAKGATVIVSGKLVNYKGNTPETVQNSGTLVSVNGQAPELAE
ncbi:hypothetical protein SAMN06298211_10954 [Prevotellaceae bacterium MN60]|nr:hypothetical protein SAMN06298211_10954 [Prevotellaceae bacterium MN60]